jgi:multidrug resistance efflux pump
VLRTFVVVMAILAAATAGGTYVVRQRLAANAFVDLGTAVLTAEPVPVGSANAGVITEMMVTEQSHVTAGQDLARIMLPVTGTSRQPQTEVLHAPTSGTVSAVNLAVGGVVQPGQPIITLYDEAKLTFQAQVPVKDLRELRLGMSAAIDGPGLDHRVAATLDHVVPRVGTSTLTATDRLTVVLVPKASEVDTVRTLVPGLQFQATADTKTAVGRTPAVNSAR